MQSIKYMLGTNWHLMRVIRLIAGIAIAVHALYSTDALSGMLAAFILFQAITNTGCCGVNGCDVPQAKDKSE